MKKFILYMVCTFAGLQALSAQEILIQWTGVIRDELLHPISYANIIVHKDFRGTISDQQGKFTIITFPRDTLLVSCMGYKPRKVPVPNFQYEDSKHYIKDIIMVEDTIMLKEVKIFPWRTYKEFKDAFLALELPDDDMLRAYHNIVVLQEQIASTIASRPASPTTNFRDVMNTRTNRMMTYGHFYPSYSITNPIAWAQFIQALRNGEFKKKESSSSAKPPTVVEAINHENSK